MIENPVITLLCPPGEALLDTERMSAVRRVLGDCRSEWLHENHVADFLPDAQADAASVLTAIRTIIGTLPIDIALQDRATRRKKALIADMDSTMIDQECIDELAAEVGLKDKVAAITARAMNGEIEFEPALRERVALLAGLPDTIAGKVIEQRITLASGGPVLLATMKAANCHCVLVSGGFSLFTSHIASALGFDEHHANRLEIQNGKLTGRVIEPVLGKQAKIDTLERVAKEQQLSPEDFIAVGDGANDLGMLGAAGTGVALHAKPVVAEKAKFRIDHGDLTSLLHLQGYRAEEFVSP
ncbi:phosphoserine phosphatase SerB [Salaquimonas pukyongi]|uniref:phosphoserine phosphatase SerB n=1 Tax=Salaquimonas pukyongi TaxID=2712698 RepID=UPI00096BCBF9|nr:phosphoserine phosphatase SerB [Salaquimonas pukyongi]